MKYSNLMLGFILSASALLAPMKKAHAGLIIGSTPMVFTAAAVGIPLAFVEAIREDDMNYETKFDRIAPVIFFGFLGLMVLDGELDGLETKLAKKYPSIPAYIVKEAIFSLKDKARLIPFDKNGLKEVSMSEEEFSDLEAAIPSSASSAEVAGLHKLLSSQALSL